MSGLDFLDRKHERERFREWLIARGARFTATKGEWEFWRAGTPVGLMIIYRNSKGRYAGNKAAADLLREWEAGDLINPPVVRKQDPGLLQADRLASFVAQRGQVTAADVAAESGENMRACFIALTRLSDSGALEVAVERRGPMTFSISSREKAYG